MTDTTVTGVQAPAKRGRGYVEGSVRKVETYRDGVPVRVGWLMRIPDELAGGFLLRMEGESHATPTSLTEMRSLALPVRNELGDESDNVWWRTLLEAAEALS
jgi:hypothetical protein